MSSRNVLQLLRCLQYSYKTAEQFDSRPGLKFLIQKVSKSDVAANMYKQTGVSLLLNVQTLLEICAHQNNLCEDNSKKILWGANEEERDKLSEVVRKASLTAYFSTKGVLEHTVFFMHRFRDMLDELCTNYVDLYLEKEGPNAADRLSKQLLVFLVADNDNEIATLKRDKSIKEMVQEKLKERKKKEEQAGGIGSVGAGAAGVSLTTETVNVQGNKATVLALSNPFFILLYFLKIDCNFFSILQYFCCM